MYFGECLRTTLVEVWAHKLRSALTLVGVVLGTLAVVAMVSLIEAVKVEVWNGIATAGYDEVMFVDAAAPRTPLDAKRAHLSEGLRREDAAAVAAGTDLVKVAAPIAFTRQVVAWGEKNRAVRVIATTPEYARLLRRKVAEGRYLTDYDQLRKRRVVVVGHELKKELFGTAEPVGEWVRIGDHSFEVVGVGARIGSEFIQDGYMRAEMGGATIPLSTFQALYAEDERIPTLGVKVASSDNLSGLAAFLKNRLWRQHRRVEDFRITNIAEIVVQAKNRVDRDMRGWTIVLFSISAISLVVGGVGIFSILQISLAERLYEIGLRKSIGATDGAVLAQFLTESVFLSSLGAAVGFGLSVLVCTALSPRFQAGLPISGFAVTLALLFAVGVGLAAGLYPSLKAARMTPVEALRGE